MMKDRFGRIYIGDIITKIESTNVNSKDDIFHELEKYKIGDSIKIQYFRVNKLKTITIKFKQL